jgi:hypothetical protein
LILQGFIPQMGIAKTTFSGYNITYFLQAVFRTGKYQADSLISRRTGGLQALAGLILSEFSTRGRRFKRSVLTVSADSARRGRGKIVPERFTGWKF